MPRLIRVRGSTTLRPWSKHQRMRSLLRVGSRKPFPAIGSLAPIRALSSSFDSPAVWPKKPRTVV